MEKHFIDFFHVSEHVQGVAERLSLKFLLITQARNNIMDRVIYHFFTDAWTFWYLVFTNKIRLFLNSIFQDFRRADILDAKKGHLEF